MGFGDFFKKVGEFALETGKEVGKDLLEHAKEMKQLKEELQYAPDSKLEDLIRNGNKTEKIVANSLLKERGYSTEELKKLWGS